jgi:hypothetical protein
MRPVVSAIGLAAELLHGSSSGERYKTRPLSSSPSMRAQMRRQALHFTGHAEIHLQAVRGKLVDVGEVASEQLEMDRTACLDSSISCREERLAGLAL